MIVITVLAIVVTVAKIKLAEIVIVSIMVLKTMVSNENRKLPIKIQNAQFNLSYLFVA